MTLDAGSIFIAPPLPEDPFGSDPEYGVSTRRTFTTLLCFAPFPGDGAAAPERLSP